MGTTFVFYNQTRDQKESSLVPSWVDATVWRNIERYGHDNAKRAFEKVIQYNKWDTKDKILAIGDSFNAQLTYHNGNIDGLDIE